MFMLKISTLHVGHLYVVVHYFGYGMFFSFPLWHNMKEILYYCSSFVFQSVTNSADDLCDHWKSWSAIAGISSSVGGYIFNYFIYVLIAVVFAGLAGFYVTTLAPYASGSGIPEVCVCVCVCV